MRNQKGNKQSCHGTYFVFTQSIYGLTLSFVVLCSLAPSNDLSSLPSSFLLVSFNEPNEITFFSLEQTFLAAASDQR